MTKWTGVAMMGALLWTAVAGAGILDAPPPSFGGTAGRVIYRMGPVEHDSLVDTVVTCSNAADVAVELAVEVFDARDQALGLPTRATTPVGGAVTFVTSADAGVPGATVILGLPALEDGKARVSATTSQIACTAKHRIRSETGGIREAVLELVKKVAFGD